jgi:hypothetical protein
MVEIKPMKVNIKKEISVASVNGVQLAIRSGNFRVEIYIHILELTRNSYEICNFTLRSQGRRFDSCQGPKKLHFSQMFLVRSNKCL